MAYIMEWIPFFLFSVMLLYICFAVSLYIFRMNSRAKKKQYTYDVCRNDSRNYEYLFGSQMRSFHENIEFFKSQQAEAIQFFNKLAVGVKKSILDEDILYDCYYEYFIQAYNATNFLFLQYNNEFKKPDLYIDFFKLLNRWKDRGDRNHV